MPSIFLARGICRAPASTRALASDKMPETTTVVAATAALATAFFLFRRRRKDKLAPAQPGVEDVSACPIFNTPLHMQKLQP